MGVFERVTAEAARIAHRLCGIRRVLVVGPSGAGKTFIAHHLRAAHHEPVIDADDLKQLCRWVDDENHAITFNVAAGKRWLKTHHFIWDRAYLKHYLAQYRRIYIFGLSKNIFDMTDLFDQIFFLDISAALDRTHLSSPLRRNPWGKHKHQRELTVHSLRLLRAQAKAAGATCIAIHNADISPDDIFSQIR